MLEMKIRLLLHFLRNSDFLIKSYCRDEISIYKKSSIGHYPYDGFVTEIKNKKPFSIQFYPDFCVCYYEYTNEDFE